MIGKLMSLFGLSNMILREYVVHGARIVCDGCPGCRSFLRVDGDHGWFVRRRPLALVSDCVPNTNIRKFDGACSFISAKPDVLEAMADYEKENPLKLSRYMSQSSRDSVTDRWNYQRDTALLPINICNYAPMPMAENGNTVGWVPGREDFFVNEVKALTIESVLHCVHGGVITIDWHGQAE